VCGRLSDGPSPAGSRRDLAAHLDRFKAANRRWPNDVVVCHPVCRKSSSPPHDAAFSFRPVNGADRGSHVGSRACRAATPCSTLPHLLSRHPDAVLAIAGDGDDRPRLEARAAGLGITPAVRFLGRVDETIGSTSSPGVPPVRDAQRGRGVRAGVSETMRAASLASPAAGPRREIINTA
jgi:hypothetical protein